MIKKIKKRERKRDFFLFPSNFNFIFLNAALWSFTHFSKYFWETVLPTIKLSWRAKELEVPGGPSTGRSQTQFVQGSGAQWFFGRHSPCHGVGAAPSLHTRISVGKGENSQTRRPQQRGLQESGVPGPEHPSAILSNNFPFPSPCPWPLIPCLYSNQFIFSWNFQEENSISQKC